MPRNIRTLLTVVAVTLVAALVVVCAGAAVGSVPGGSARYAGQGIAGAPLQSSNQPSTLREQQPSPASAMTSAFLQVDVGYADSVSRSLRGDRDHAATADPAAAFFTPLRI